MKTSRVLMIAALLAAAPVARGQAPRPLRLADGTTIELRLEQTISSAYARVGDKVQFRVVNEIRVDRVPVILKGASAVGTVTAARPKRRMGRAGQLDVTIDSVRLVDGEQAPLRSTERSVGEGKGGLVAGGAIAAGLVFWPAAPAFLLMHGADVTMPEGTEITAYVEGDLELEAANFPPPPDYGPVRTALAGGETAAAVANVSAARREANYPGVVNLK